MGTRHHQTVIDKNGEIKLLQYGQWDGYPSGQGVEILRYLKNGNLTEYQAQLKKIRFTTPEDDAIVEKEEKWNEKWPHLSRDCGSRIHALIEAGQVEFVGKCDMKEANSWCEGFYTIDFSQNTFTTRYRAVEKTYPLDQLPDAETYIAETETNQ